MMKFLKFHRSAIAPVGIVAVVSMNTIWNRNRQKMAVSNTEGLRKNPAPPMKPHLMSPMVMPCSTFNSASPCPNEGCQPMATGPL